MARTLSLIVIASLLLICCDKRTEQPPPQTRALTWHDSLEDLKPLAEQTGDCILLSFEASWCPWSQLLRDSLYVHDAVVESLAAYRLATIDVDRDTILSREFGVVLYPTVVITDAYGCELGRIVGYTEPEEFMGRLSLIGRREDILSEMYRREERVANNCGFLLSFARLLSDLGMYDGALLRYERAMEADKDGTSGVREEAAYSMAECYMLSGQYMEAGRRFRLFARSHPENQRSEEATILAALCYQRVNYKKVATQIYEDYLATFGGGAFEDFARARLDSLGPRGTGGS
jgi:tetratricopeptide (TPR) repeat protein